MHKPHPEAESPAYKIVNAEELALNLLRLFEQGGRVLTEFIERADTKMGP
jgi:polyhydroxyalkanoate synthase